MSLVCVCGGGALIKTLQGLVMAELGMGSR